MTGPLSLSNELLIHVFSSCTTIQSATALSGVDKTLHSIWREYNDRIAKSVLRQQIPEYEDAVDLSILDEIWCNKNTKLASTVSTVPTTQVPVRSYSKQLLHNSKLAISATDLPRERLIDEYIFSPDHVSLHAAYYLLRKIALAYMYPEAQLQNALYSTLRTYSEAYEERLEMLQLYLCVDAHKRERRKHGIDKPISDWTPEDEANEGLLMGFVVAEPWNYVHSVIRALKDDRGYRSPGTNELDRVLGVTDTVAV
jgi:hypothetical protein